MNTKENLVADLRRVVEAVFEDQRIDELVLDSLAEEIAEKAVGIKPTVSGELVTVKKLKGHAPEIVHYSPIEAARVIAHVIEAVADPTNFVLLGSAVISCGVALTGLRKVAPPAESTLFWVICNCDNNRASRDKALELFQESCKSYDTIRPEDFAPALDGLLKWGFIREDKETLSVVERIHRSNLASIIDS